MPFQSEKQRKYLWANEPEIARDWTDKYGSRVKKQEGGIGGIEDLFQTIGSKIIPEEHMDNWGDALIAKNKPWTTTPEYHQWGAQDLAQQMSKKISDVPYVGNLAAGAFELAAPFVAGGASPFYDIPQAFVKYYEDPGKYEVNNKWDKINAYFPDLQGTTVSGILNAIDMEDPLSAAWNRGIGAGKPFINRMKSGWDAIKNEFGGSAEAAEMPRQINRFGKTIGPLANTVTQDKRPVQNFTFSPYQGPSQEEEGWDYRTPRKMGMLERFRNKFYKPATSAAGGYNVSQLNKMNALGGYYSEPARQQRRLMNRRTNILKRAGEGKPIGNVNLLKDYGYKKSPSGGVTFTGQHEGSSTAGAGYSRSDSGWSSSPFRRGGLASLWQR